MSAAQAGFEDIRVRGDAEGSCLCGGVRWGVRGEMRGIVACHCGQCRKQTGSYMTAIRAATADFRLRDPEGLTVWYRSSAAAQRGFCSRCGSTLFWRRCAADGTPEAGGISIAAGGLDRHPGALRVAGHIFAADKADWLHLPDGEPVREEAD